MNGSLIRWLFGTTDAAYSVFLRISVGLIFCTQGFLKYVDPNLGVNRFEKIGFPYPDFTAHFVGAFEMVCGLLVLVGLWTRAAAIPLLIVNLTAIASTKIPELWTSGEGFWYMVTDIRTDFAMLLSLLYLFAAGSGRYTFQEALLGAWGGDEVPENARGPQST